MKLGFLSFLIAWIHNLVLLNQEWVAIADTSCFSILGTCAHTCTHTHTGHTTFHINFVSLNKKNTLENCLGNYRNWIINYKDFQVEHRVLKSWLLKIAFFLLVPREWDGGGGSNRNSKSSGLRFCHIWFNSNNLKCIIKKFFMPLSAPVYYCSWHM